MLGLIPAPSCTTCEPEPYSGSSPRDDQAAPAASTTWHCLLHPRDLLSAWCRQSNPHSYLIKGELSPPTLCVKSSGLVRLINLANFKLLGGGRARTQTQIWPQMSHYFVPLGFPPYCFHESAGVLLSLRAPRRQHLVFPRFIACVLVRKCHTIFCHRDPGKEFFQTSVSPKFCFLRGWFLLFFQRSSTLLSLTSRKLRAKSVAQL